MTIEGIWEVGASIGAVNAIREYHKEMTLNFLAEAERLALKRAELFHQEPAILRCDVEMALGKLTYHQWYGKGR